MVFLTDYRVTLAEKVIPATDLSEQVSHLGMQCHADPEHFFAVPDPTFPVMRIRIQLSLWFRSGSCLNHVQGARSFHNKKIIVWQDWRLGLNGLGQEICKLLIFSCMNNPLGPWWSSFTAAVLNLSGIFQDICEFCKNLHFVYGAIYYFPVI